MAQQNATLAILFADVSKSTRLYEVLGDQAAQEIIAKALKRLADAADRHGGTVIKTIGDEIMCTFPSAGTAVEAARDMQRSLGSMKVSDEPGLTHLNIYVGLHYGPVVLENGDVFGDAVNVAARMVAHAKPRQILTTEETVDLLPVEQKGAAQYSDTTTVKGKTGEIHVHEIVWERTDVTVMVDRKQLSDHFRLRLELRVRNRTVVVDHNKPTISLGRQSHNDMVVNDSRVSRTHARIEYRRGTFVLVDESTNGTFVKPEGGDPVRLNMDEHRLVGQGVIVLGRENAFDSPDSICYFVKV
ncbi:MAG: adenylate/guanylate cyclase domain-containing protein [Desulfatibacillaceae bacterium]